MTTYTAPVRDTQFLFDEVFDVYETYKNLPAVTEINSEFVNSVLEEAGKFASQEVHPINYGGDKEGCRWDNGKVTAPEGYREVHEKYVEGGWTQLSENTEFGGQGLPRILSGALLEFLMGASPAFGIYSNRDGSIAAIERNATQALKNKYLPNLVNGSWVGTMAMTEAHCGSDLGLLRTKAEPQSDGCYKITGTKIFITGGDGGMGDNTIHLVLARIPGSPEGIKGISLFVLPKYLINDDGTLGEENNVYCSSIEHKMGLNASATCTMNFEASRGWLIGDVDKGMRAMFAMVNQSRFLVGVQATGLSEVAYQNAAAYARDRIQMRSLTGAQNPGADADPIIVHPDVRRMLLSQRAFAEGSRALNTYIGVLFDQHEHSKDEASRIRAGHLLGLLTPICKGFGSEMGTENTNLALQCFGGHGFIAETGVEQFVRDMRIAQLYEGTTGIQGLDLLARKVLGSQGATLKILTDEIAEFCADHVDVDALKMFITPLLALTSQWRSLSAEIGRAATEKTADELGSAAVDYLMFSGYVTLAYMWARMAKAALGKDQAFYQAKLQTAQFYYQRILPRTQLHAQVMLSGAEYLMNMHADDF